MNIAEVVAFVEEACEVGGGGWEPKGRLFREFQQWYLRRVGWFEGWDEGWFFRYLFRRWKVELRSSRRRMDGELVPGVEGVRLKIKAQAEEGKGMKPRNWFGLRGVIYLDCSECRETKAASEFSPDRRKSSGRQGRCKMCRAARVLKKRQWDTGIEIWRKGVQY